jgi:hypothetical protein
MASRSPSPQRAGPRRRDVLKRAAKEVVRTHFLDDNSTEVRRETLRKMRIFAVMHTTVPETRLVDGLGRAIADLLQALNQLLAALVNASWSPLPPAQQRDSAQRVRDVGWLRPLAIASVELEHTLRRPSVLRAVTVAARCEELTRLLVPSTASVSDFAERYALERAKSPSLATLHARVMAGCDQVTSRCSPNGKVDR